MAKRTDSNSRSSPGREEGYASIGLVFGGSFQQVAQYSEVTATDLVFLFDVQSEVARVTPRVSSNVVALSLATGETLGTLTQKNCPDGLMRFFKERPGVNLDDGFAAMR